VLPPPALGISYEGKPTTLLGDVADLVDVVEIVPDRFVARYSDRVGDRTFASLDEYVPHAEVAYHGVGLSMGTASGWNDAYLGLLERLCEHRAPRWHSEHLGFTIVDGHFLGTMVAVPATMEAADLLTTRAAAVRARLGIDFLLEHVASPLVRPDELAPAEFLNVVARGSGWGVLLDLHNLECDEDNGQLRIREFLDELDLDLVKEIHVAGGVWRDGYHLDRHAGLPDPSTLSRLEATIPHCPNVELVVFEMHGDAIETVGRETVGRETVGRETVGRETVGRETVGRETVGGATVGRGELKATLRGMRRRIERVHVAD
jgi:uncharacterized protein (UPF0276 family)